MESGSKKCPAKQSSSKKVKEERTHSKNSTSKNVTNKNKNQPSVEEEFFRVIAQSQTANKKSSIKISTASKKKK